MYYRCGWCGVPTNKEGIPKSKEEIENMYEDDLINAQHINGQCCEAEAYYRSEIESE